MFLVVQNRYSEKLLEAEMHSMKEFSKKEIELACDYWGNQKEMIQDLKCHGIDMDELHFTPTKIRLRYKNNDSLTDEEYESLVSSIKTQQEYKKRFEENEKARKEEEKDILYDEFGKSYRVVYDKWNGWHRAYINHEMGG